MLPVTLSTYRFFVTPFMLMALSACSSHTSNIISPASTGAEYRQSNDVCLLAPLKTNQGIILPTGTRGTFSQYYGQDAFFTFEYGEGNPKRHDIAGRVAKTGACLH